LITEFALPPLPLFTAAARFDCQLAFHYAFQRPMLFSYFREPPPDAAAFRLSHC